MPIISICCMPFGGGERIGKSLAQKRGCAYLSREDIVSRANEYGIPVGKLELAAMRRPASQERLARLKERYLAIATATICEKAEDEDIVYSGRAGHLVLTGVSHVLRVLVLPDEAQRLQNAMERTRLSREKAEKFLADVDDDIRNWVHFIHGVNMEDPRRYDFIVNLERTSIENAAAALCTIADLPDFAPTPASRKAIGDRLLQSRARMMLALDDRTSGLDLTVRSSDGVLTVMYMFRQASEARCIPEVLSDLPGCRDLHCTMASTRILWIQEDFQTTSTSFKEVTELARRWEAAVELLRYSPQGPAAAQVMTADPAPLGPAQRKDGGVEEDSPETALAEKDARLRMALDELINEGLSGGGQAVSGPRERVLEAISPAIPYSLIVVGDMYTNKPAAARTRMTRDLASFLGRNVKSSVVSLAELGDKLHVGQKQVFRFAAAILIVATLYTLLFLKQDVVLQLLGGEGHKIRPWIAPLLIAALAPLVAGLYGSVAGFFLKLFKFD